MCGIRQPGVLKSPGADMRGAEDLSSAPRLSPEGKAA